MRYIILGGTGTLGNEITKQLLRRSETEQITIFSRDELKQKQMKSKFEDNRLHFVLGDIRDRQALKRLIYGKYTDVVFNFAALKHLDVLEDNPEESVNTNILGTINLADICEETGIEKVVFSSTDKAVDPINVYGYSKAISERILLNRNKNDSATRYFVFRWGNILGSRGSVINYFFDQIKNDRKINITDPFMTRFWMLIEQAADFMLSVVNLSEEGGLFIPPDLKSASIIDVLHAISKIAGKRPSEIEYNIIGNRGGEKDNESLMSRHDSGHISSLNAPRFTSGELEEIIRKALGV